MSGHCDKPTVYIAAGSFGTTLLPSALSRTAMLPGRRRWVHSGHRTGANLELLLKPLPKSAAAAAKRRVALPGNPNLRSGLGFLAMASAAHEHSAAPQLTRRPRRDRQRRIHRFDPAAGHFLTYVLIHAPARPSEFSTVYTVGGRVQCSCSPELSIRADPNVVGLSQHKPKHQQRRHRSHSNNNNNNNYV